MQNDSKGAILQVITNNSNVNAVILQAMEYTTVAEAVYQPVATQNSQKIIQQLYVILHVIVVW